MRTYVPNDGTYKERVFLKLNANLVRRFIVNDYVGAEPSDRDVACECGRRKPSLMHGKHAICSLISTVSQNQDH